MIHRREQRQFVITKLLFPAACARLHIFLTEVRKISVAANAFRKRSLQSQVIPLRQ